jgi:hypothetical protein
MKISLQLIKLTNGDTVVTDVVEETETTLLVNNPLEIRTERNIGRSHSNILAYQWFPLLEEDNFMTIQKAHIVGMAPAAEEMADYYITALDRMIYDHDEDKKSETDKRDDIIDAYEYFANTSNIMIH